LPGSAFDLLAIGAALVLVGCAVANLSVVDGVGFAARQASFAVVGMSVVALLWRLRLRLLGVLGWTCYGVSVALLVAVFAAGSSANGATRWIGVGPVGFQPSELAKLGLVLVLGSVLGSPRPPWQRFGLAIGLALIPVGLTVVEPDLSTATLLVGVLGAMVVLGRAPVRAMLALCGVAMVAAPLIIVGLRPYQLERLNGFLTGSHAPSTGAGWTVQQAHIAFGAGPLHGPSGESLAGLLARYLPERETDLAVASLVEQYGPVAGAVALGAALVLVWRLALATRLPRSVHGGLVCGGLAILFGVETVVSVGGNLGLLPLAGVPFPLLSYGGSALVVHLAALGVALGIRRDGVRRRLWVAHGWRSRPRLVRVGALGLTLLVVISGLYGWRLRAVQGPALAAAALEEMTRCIRLPAHRGTITDRHGAPLAQDDPTGLRQLVAVPALVRADPGALAQLARLTGQPPSALRATLDTAPATTLAVPLAEIPPVVAAAASRAGIPGVTVVPRIHRTSPAGAVLGPVLGFTGVATPVEARRWPGLPSGEIVGRSGLEQRYDPTLRGVDGSQCVYVDPTGLPVAMGPRTEPVAGADLRLSLDLGLQRELTAALATALPGRRGALGGAVALDPRTGQLLALASLPTFDNNIYGPPVDSAALRALADTPGSPLREHATGSSLPPGSTFKLVVAAANLCHPVLPPTRTVPTGASFTLGGHTFNNWRPFGPMDLVGALAWSNDVYFYQLATALGPDAIIAAATALGVGRPSGIDLPDESPGYLGTPASVRQDGAAWYPGSTVILGIGQGYLTATPLQTARWTGAVTTGSLVTPRLGLAVGADHTHYAALPAPPPTPLPFAAALGPIGDGMRAAVTGGTATRLADLPTPVGAKTGTAQDGVLPEGTYDNWMTAAVPIRAPSLVMTAMVQGPGLGANNAGVVVHDALAYYLAHQPEILATAPVRGQ
jgi:cell division protein FtsI/penicillin-binding protein 2/cell division protein FtsW (lipid II flippase)